MKKFFTLLLSTSGKVSCKRFWGSIILVMLCFGYIWCTIKATEMVSHTDAFLTLAGVLLGIETAVSPFNKNKETNEDGTASGQ